MRWASASLFDRLIARHFSWNAAIVGMRFEPLEPREVVDPAFAQRRIQQPRKPRIAQHHEAPRRDAIGHVVKALRPQLGEVTQHGLLQELANAARPRR